MVRLRNRDDLDDVQGRLGVQFRTATLTTLHAAFLSVAGADEKKAATVLENFYQAADDLGSREKEFNSRARPAGAPSLMGNLRGAAQLEALRGFNDAKRDLFEIDPKIGRSIARLVERDIDAVARTSALSL